MKTLQKVAMVIALITLFSSCRSNTDTKQILSNKETRKGIIDTIANNGEMMKEMTEAMMNSKNGKMMMQGNEKMTMMMMEDQGAMMKMMKENPAMMHSMMSGMMETCKNDTAMMSTMCKSMMENPEMMDMMHKKMGGKMDMKGMKGMNKTDGIDKKMK